MTTQPSALSAQPLKGYINTFFVYRNGHRYGPYYVRRWKVGRKIYKQYIKPADLNRVRAACQAYKERRIRQRAKSQELNNIYANLNYLTRIAKRQDKGPLRPEDYAYLRRIEQHGYAIAGRPTLRSSPAQQGGSARRAMGAHIAHLLSLPRTDAVAQLVAGLNNRQPEGFMVPSFTNSSDTPPSLDGRGRGWVAACLSTNFEAKELQMQDKPIPDPIAKRMKKTCRRLIASTFSGESKDEKWKRWTDEKNSPPISPTNPPIALPDWLTEEEIDNMIKDHIETTLARKRAKLEGQNPTPPPAH